MQTQRTRARRASGNVYLKKGARGHSHVVELVGERSPFLVVPRHAKRLSATKPASIGRAMMAAKHTVSRMRKGVKEHGGGQAGG
jgi:hypothetical protein